MMTAYGHRIESSEDEFTRLAKDFSEELTNTGSAGTTLVDIFPIRWCYSISSEVVLI